ncbi:MAG: hypothetical protein NVSMB57_17270 [Actinomycetota bacterium]
MTLETVRSKHPGLKPANETDRLAAVRRYDVLDTPPDGAFDRITAIAARVFDVPISIVSIVDSDRIWFKSHHGVDVEQIDREPGLCASAILQNEPWIVENAEIDPRTLANPLVAGELGLRFYAAAPLRTHDGYNLGTLCLIDTEPRELSEDQIHTLEDLSSVVMDELELRRAARKAVLLESESRHTAEELARTLQESLLPVELPLVPGLEFACRYHTAFHDVVGGDFYDVIVTEAGCAAVIGDACGKGAKAAALTGIARWTIRSAPLNEGPGKTLHRLNQVIANADRSSKEYITAALVDFRTVGEGADLTVAIGGHPHPVVVRVDGAVETIGVTAPLIGWNANVVYPEATTRLSSGDFIVLLTDGFQNAIEARGGIDKFHTELSATAGTDAETVAKALDTFIGEDLRDDAAFLIARVT